jgi:release factor glutamine methyltransferase
MTIGEQYGTIKRLLAHTDEADAEAKTILAYALGLPFSDLFLRFAEECPRAAQIDEIVRRRAAGMPLAYAIRQKAFYGYDFYVDERVLIPRADSECVAECAIRLAEAAGYETALDLCCGSGCLGVVLLKESRVKGVCFADISADALQVAARNAAAIAPGAACSFIQGDLFEHIGDTFDLIVCNPPYVSAAEYEALEPQIKDYEPRAALLAGNGGYAFYERIAAQCGARLNSGGAIVLETGDTQGARVAGLLADAGFDQPVCGTDLAGRPRFVSGVKRER